MRATHFIDDSGEESMQFTLMGGPVYAQKDLHALEYEWDRLCLQHQITGPIHMRNFGRPNGRLAHLTNDQRLYLFQDLVLLINRKKIYSLTVAVNNLEFEQYFPVSQFRGYMGSAPLAYLWCMILNQLIMKKQPMAYVVARSNVNSQIADCYSFWESVGSCESLGFDEPRNLSALQAADMVAWANRRKQDGLSFDEGFEALERLTRYVESKLKPSIHFHFVVSEESTKKLAAILGSPTRQKGKRISLLKVIPPEMRKLIHVTKSEE